MKKKIKNQIGLKLNRLVVEKREVVYLAVRRPEPIKFETAEIFEPLALMLVTEEATFTPDAVMEAAEMGKLLATVAVDATTFEDKLFETIVAVFTQLLPVVLFVAVAKRGKSS